jgi:hypothetical protein
MHEDQNNQQNKIPNTSFRTLLTHAHTNR